MENIAARCVGKPDIRWLSPKLLRPVSKLDLLHWKVNANFNSSAQYIWTAFPNLIKSCEKKWRKLHVMKERDNSFESEGVRQVTQNGVKPEHLICMRRRRTMDNLLGVFCRKASQQTLSLRLALYGGVTVLEDIRLKRFTGQSKCRLTLEKTQKNNCGIYGAEELCRCWLRPKQWST